jgi:predicted  nucleic acid-binding Zn-ribbon protein
MNADEIGDREVTNAGDYVNYLGGQLNEASDRIVELNETVISLDAKIREENGLITELNEVITDLEGQLNGLQGEIGRLKAERAAQETQLGRLGNDYSTAQANIKTLEAEKDELIRKLEIANETNSAQVAELSGKIEELKQRIQQLSDEISQKNTQIEALQRERSGSELQVSRLNGEVNRLNSEMRNLKKQVSGLKEKNAALELKVKELSGNIERLEVDNFSLRSQASNLENEKVALSKKVNDLTGENEALRRKVQEKEEALAALRSEKTNLERDIDAKTQKIEAQMKATVANAARWLGSWAGICRRADSIVDELGKAKANLEGQLSALKDRIEGVERQWADDASKLTERERELRQTQDILQNKEFDLLLAQRRLDETNKRLKSLNGQLADTNENLQSTRNQLVAAEGRLSATERTMGNQLAAAEGKLSAARNQLQRTETRLIKANEERNEANASSAQWRMRLAEFTRQNEDLVSNVRRLESKLEFTQIQLDSKKQEQDSISRRGNELNEQLEATRARLAEKTAEFDQVQKENEQLRAQLENAEREVKQYRETLSDLLNALQGEVAGETDEVVLGGLRKLQEVTSSLPGDIAVNLHVRCLNRTIENIAEIKDAIAQLEDKIFSAPERQRAEFEANLEQAGRAVAAGARCGEEYNPALERFCKIGAGINVDYGDRDLSAAEFLAVANSVAKRSFEVLLRDDEDLAKLRGLVGDRIDIDASMNQYFTRVTEEFAAYVQEGHFFHECFNRLGELVGATRDQAIENVKNFAAGMILDAIKTGDSGAGDGQISHQFIENFVVACGGQGECFARMVSVEADRIATLTTGMDVPDLDGAIAAMREYTAFDDARSVDDFLLQARIRLAQAFDGPISTLAQHRFVDQGDGTWQDPDVVKGVFTQVNEECNHVLRRLHFGNYLNARNLTAGGVVDVGSLIDEVSAIVNREVFSEAFQNFFASGKSIEDTTLQLNNFILWMLQPIRGLNPEQFDEIAKRALLVKLPGEEMVACFCKVRDCVANGDVDSATFQVALNKFFLQFILTACDSLGNLQSVFPFELASVFDMQKSTCWQLLNRFNLLG